MRLMPKGGPSPATQACDQLIPGPVVNDITGAAPLDQGSVLAVRVFGFLSIYFTPQPEVVPIELIF